jgi:AAA+ ATPase superfamily predicted ATPase
MEFIDRQEEMSRLNHLIRLRESSVAVIWGRRRIGKTRLLLEWVKKHRGIYYCADESAVSIQRHYFALALEQVLPGFAQIEYPDWTTFFQRLSREAIQAKYRGPIVIDELPYLISVSPELPSILQKFIDHDAKKAKLILALCGSSQRMMQGAILEASAPLYVRASEILKLKPIAPGHMKAALKLKKPRDVIESYAIWGGIPRYWELLEKNKGSFLEKIDRLVLDPMGPLNDEPNHLLLEESPPAIHLRPILDAIGLGAHRLSEVAARIGQPVTSLMRPIQRLIELDLIQRETPFDTEECNSKKTLYKIKDPFARFWFTLVAPKRSLFMQAAPSTRIQLLKEALPYLFSLMWEELCRLAVPLLFKGTYGQAGRFWNAQGPEWDILARSNDGNNLLIGEAKWTLKAPSRSWVYQTIEELKNKGTPPIQRRAQMQFKYALFLSQKPAGFQAPPGVSILDARDVVRVLM